jgi:beta-glucosidase
MARERHVNARAVAAIAALGLAATPVFAGGSLAAGAEPSARTSAPADRSNTQDAYVAARRRADRLVARLTLDEKIQLAHGVGFLRDAGFAGRVTGVPRLGIPDLVLADGPNGVGNGAKGVTAFPASIGTAATWDTRLVRRYGGAIGREQAGKGNNVALAPTINIVRVPQWGRAFESFSEDPRLTADLASAEIKGVQAEGVIADAKHFAANNQETDRAFNEMVVPERTLREIYLPAFEAAVKRGGVLSAMCAYNRVNGRYACQNESLMTDILKREWGFRGLVVSDWAATHSSGRSARAGLDLEMPFGPEPDYPQFFGESLKADVQAGRLRQARLDDMVARVLTAMVAVGLLDRRPAGDQSKTVTTPAHQRLARTLAAQGTVLLKNRGKVLPLNPRRVSSLAVIGATAQDAPIYTGGGSASVVPSRTTTPLDGIRARARGMRVTYAPGTKGTPALPEIPRERLIADGGQSGVATTYYPTPDFSGTPVATRREATVGFTSSPSVPGLRRVWSARSTATFTPPSSGTHRFSLDTIGVADVYLDGRRVLHAYGRDRSPIAHALVELTAGKPVRLRVDYVAQKLPRRIASLKVGWLPPEPQLAKTAVDAARAADAAIVFINDLRTEGGDGPSLALPGDQDRLVGAVARANPRTVVVLNTGGATLMPWIERVAGVVEAWYPGQANGDAIARVLFGDVNPSAKLPVTFPRSDAQSPVAAARRWPGIGGVAHYDEGLRVGYRWYDARRKRPLFPFGHGLSYTRFRYGALHVARVRRGADWRVHLRVRNIGKRSGAEVVQLYVGFPPAAGEPPRQLKGFRKLQLRPGRSALVTFPLTTRDLASWSTAGHRWRTHRGRYRIMVGSSSRDIRRAAALQLGAK